MFDFSGKVALVTGGSRGLGYQMVRALAERGAEVIVASRNIDNCRAVALEMRGLGRQAIAVQVDTSDWQSIDRLIETSYAEFGRVDIAVNNAGAGSGLPSHEVTEALFDRIVDLNFKGPFRISASVAKRMYDGDGGVIVNVSSVGGLFPLPGRIPYGSAKAAVNAMSRSLAAEYGPRVRVNTVSPGFFATDMTTNYSTEHRQSITSALSREGRPEEIVTAVLCLASPSSSFITGATVQVDGGQVGCPPATT